VRDPTTTTAQIFMESLGIFTFNRANDKFFIQKMKDI